MPVTSTRILPLSPTLPPGSVISPQHNASLRTSPDAPYFRSSHPVLVPETIPPAEPPLSSDPSVTRSDNALAREPMSESHSSTLATSPPEIPQSVSGPDPGAAEDGGYTKAILHKDKDALDLPLVHHVNTMTGFSTVTDVSIEGPSRRSGYRCDTI